MLVGGQGRREAFPGQAPVLAPSSGARVPHPPLFGLLRARFFYLLLVYGAHPPTLLDFFLSRHLATAWGQAWGVGGGQRGGVGVARGWVYSM